jgi:hypothetical protein
MEPWSEEAYRDAYTIRWRAEVLAGVQYPPDRRSNPLWVPPQWTAWLLMDKAGTPRELIARICYADPLLVKRRLRLAWALMLFPPYAARIEALMRTVPRWGGGPASPTAKEAVCAAHG